MLRTESNAALIDAVEELEVSLQTPVVPGEMVRWAEAMKRNIDKLHPVLNEQLNEVHHRTIKQIAMEDPELSTRAVALKDADRQIMQQLEKLLTSVRTLPDRVANVEPDEASMNSELEQIVNDGLKFVLDVRGQETAINTWMTESVYRDRGMGD